MPIYRLLLYTKIISQYNISFSFLFFNLVSKRGCSWLASSAFGCRNIVRYFIFFFTFSFFPSPPIAAVASVLYVVDCFHTTIIPLGLDFADLFITANWWSKEVATCPRAPLEVSVHDPTCLTCRRGASASGHCCWI